jgi:hypothetical protein
MILYEYTNSIRVRVDNDKVIISDEQDRIEYDDTPENRKKAIKEAKEIVRNWEKGL